MISANNVTLRVGKKALFEDVNIKFVEGQCYGLIGANGAGKSTFLKILTGQLEPSKGDVTITPGQRLSFLEQDHFKYDEQAVLDTVIQGNARLYDIMKEKEALYAKEDFTDEDGMKASELEIEFAEMNGWSRTGDGWYTRLVSEGAPEVDSSSTNYQPYCVEVYYAPQFYHDGAMILMYATPDEITEEDWGEYQAMKFHAYQDIPANEYREETHLDYYYVILFNQSNGEIIVVSGTSDMETVEHVAKELQIRQTGEIVKSSDFENNAVFIDVGQG